MYSIIGTVQFIYSRRSNENVLLEKREKNKALTHTRKQPRFPTTY